MFSDVSLLEALARVADPAEWEEFAQLPTMDEGDFFILGMGGPETPYTARVDRYCKLWAKFVEALRAKLISGEWVADGFNAQLGYSPVPIAPRLWKLLQIAPGQEEAEGEGFRFVSLSVSEARPSIRLDQVAHANLRTELIRYIEEIGSSSPERITSVQVREAARQAFQGTRISDTLFMEAWRAAKRPPNMRQIGRPKLKGGRNKPVD